jgi:hypothetical protein
MAYNEGGKGGGSMRTIGLFALILALVGCSAEETTEVEDTPEDTPIEEVIPVNCDEQENPIQLEATATLDAATLWRHSVTCEGLRYQDGTIILSEDSQEGTLRTGWFELPEYDELVPSWNLQQDDSSKIRIRILVDEDPSHNGILMGYWTPSYKASLGSQDTPYGRIAIDTFLPNTPTPRIAFLVTFEGGGATLKSLSLTTRLSSAMIHNDAILEDVALTLPPLAQLSIPVIGNAICSPTSLAMVLGYYEHPISPETTAALVKDEGAGIYGNWSFNASYAGGLDGLYARVEAIDRVSTMMAYLSEGIPLILSIRTTATTDLDGAIMAYPAGHLVVLAGFANINDIWYARVYDPAEYTNEHVLRLYPLNQLLSAYQGYAYVVRDTPFPSPDLPSR